MHLTREQILAAQDLRREVVNVPEWGGSITVTELTEAEYEDFVASADPKTRNAAFVALCITNDAGERLLSKDDVEALRKKSPRVISRLRAACMRVNALDKDAAEDAAKKSEPSTGTDTASS